MQKVVFTLCLFFAVSQHAAAQEQYIEVVVTDTILVEPQQWFYNVSLENSYDYSDTTTVEITKPPAKPTVKKAVPQKAVEDPLAALRTLAVANGGELLTDTGFVSYNTSPLFGEFASAAKASNYFNVKFTSRAALQQFVKAINKQTNVRGQLTGSYNSQLASFNDTLDVKIMDKAKAKAERLAQLSGRRLGKVLLVSEVTESDGHALRDFFNQLLKLEGTYGRSGSGWNAGLESLLSPDKIKLERELRLRFELQ